MNAESVPLTGITLIVGPLQAGKTNATAAILRRWLDRHGTSDVVILDFAPSIPTEDGVIGGKIDRFIELPDSVWYGTIEARGPRSEGDSIAEMRSLAKQNADRVRHVLKRAPTSPRAVFVNDVTIGYQHDPDELDMLQGYCQEATCVVLNAYKGDELTRDDPISTNERAVIDRLRQWSDREIRLG